MPRGGRRRKKATEPDDAAGQAGEELTCEQCKVIFKDEDDQLMCCDRCDLWTCLDCTDLNESHYNVFNSEQGCKLRWFCASCDTTAMKAVKTDLDIELRCKEYMGVLREEINDVKDKLDQKITKEINEVRREAQKAREEADNALKSLRQELDETKKISADNTQCNVEELINSKMNELAENSIRELQDRESRKTSLVFFNLEESAKADADQRKEDDLEKIRVTLSKLSLTAPLQKPTRLGTGNKPRPLRVTVGSHEIARNIVKEARKLEKIKGFENVYINSDMTPLERENRRKLTRKKKELNLKETEKGSGETWIISGNRLVKKAARKAEVKEPTEPTVQEAEEGHPRAEAIAEPQNVT